MEFGICNLGNVPLRSEPNDRAEIVSFVVFGEHFKINQFKEKWIEITTFHDNYEGWICSKQYKEITYEDYDNLSVNEFPINASKNAKVIDLNSNESYGIPIGSILPYYHKKNLKIRATKFTTNVSIASKDFNDLEKYALSLLNTPYLWGGRSNYGIDCSGFSQLIFRLCGISLPRDARDQAKEGFSVDFERSQKGDLAFFHNNKGVINHVGIILDNYKIIHSSGKVRIDSFKNDGIYSEKGIISHHLNSIKRFI